MAPKLNRRQTLAKLLKEIKFCINGGCSNFAHVKQESEIKYNIGFGLKNDPYFHCCRLSSSIYRSEMYFLHLKADFQCYSMASLFAISRCNKCKWSFRGMEGEGTQNGDIFIQLREEILGRSCCFSCLGFGVSGHQKKLPISFQWTSGIEQRHIFSWEHNILKLAFQASFSSYIRHINKLTSSRNCHTKSEKNHKIVP